jgi:hypothetical protein
MPIANDIRLAKERPASLPSVLLIPFCHTSPEPARAVINMPTTVIADRAMITSSVRCSHLNNPNANSAACVSVSCIRGRKVAHCPGDRPTARTWCVSPPSDIYIYLYRELTRPPRDWSSPLVCRATTETTAVRTQWCIGARERRSICIVRCGMHALEMCCVGHVRWSCVMRVTT